MDSNPSNTETPIKSEPDTEGPSQSSVNDRNSPTIPTEDSYFTEGTARPRPIRDLRDLGVILNNRRRATQHVAIRGAGAAWIDQDDSGTYDPSKERATPPATPPPRRRKRSRTDDDDDEDRPRPQKSHRAVGYRSILTFSFTSENALDYLRSISPGPYDVQSTTPDDGLSDTPLEPEEKDLFGPPLKHRKTRRITRQRSTLPRDDGLTIDQLTLGHPQRRGCKACFEVGDDTCLLIENPHDYPCTACDDADFDCELIIQPEFKKSCERCKQKRISCSYRVDGGKGVSSCEACEEADAKCIAAPLKSTALLGRGATDSSSPTPSAAVPERVFVACNQCRNNSLRCNLKKCQPGPCRNCKKNGEECAFVLKPIAHSDTTRNVTPPPGRSKQAQKKGGKKQTRRQKDKMQDPDEKHTPGHYNGRLAKTTGYEGWYNFAGKHRQSTFRNERLKHKVTSTKKQEKIHAEARRRSASTSYTPEFTPPLGISHGGIKHIYINTAFSHPIAFNYIPDPMGTSPCSWCSSPFFGLFGHGEVEVEVIPYPHIDGHGYEEMPGGHADSGKERSQMCIDCTFQRINAMACEKHKFTPVEIDPRLHVKGEMEKTVQALLVNDKKGGELAETTKWCSICPSFASFRCCVRQAEDPVESIFGSGCGLFLCENCNALMAKIAKDCRSAGDTLNRTINHASKDRFNYEYGVRADASFLTSTGELNSRIEKGMGQHHMNDSDPGTLSSDDEESDEDLRSIIERVGKGKGKWMEKQKPAPAIQKSSQGGKVLNRSNGRDDSDEHMASRSSFHLKSSHGGKMAHIQQQQQLGNKGIRDKRKSSSQSTSHGRGKGQGQVGFGGRIDGHFETEDHGTKSRKTGGIGESSTSGNHEPGLDVKGEVKAKVEGKKMSQVVVISDDEDD